MKNKVPRPTAMVTVFEKHPGYEQLYEKPAGVKVVKAIREELGSISESNEQDIVQGGREKVRPLKARTIEVTQLRNSNPFSGGIERLLRMQK